MTLEELKQIIDSENKSISESQKRIESAKEQYADEHTQFKVGDKVKITTPKTRWDKENVRFGFIAHYYYSCGNVSYKVRKCKKDGTPSMFDEYIYAVDILEKVD